MSKKSMIEEQSLEIHDLRGRGFSVPKIAQRLGIAESTVYTRLKNLKQGATNAVVLSGGTKTVISKTIETFDQIVALNDKMWKVHNGVSKLKKPKPEELSILFKADDQIQKQLKLNHDILKDLYDIKRVQVFQQTVLEVMDEVHPDIRREFVQRLNAKKEMAGAVML